MSKLYWRPTADGFSVTDNGSVDSPAESEVTEQHPLPGQLYWRPEGSDEFVPVDEGAPLPVQAAPIERRFDTDWLTIPGIVAAQAYADGDAFGTGQKAPLPRTGRITQVLFQDKDDEGSGYEVAFFSKALATIPTDNGAFSPTDIDLESYEGHINIAASDQANWASNRGGTTFVPDFEFDAPTGFLDFYMVAKGVPNIAAGNIPRIRFIGYTRE